jgi:hypothetical protein
MSKDLAVAEPKNEVTLIFDKISSGLEAFENRKEELTLLKSEAEGLKIESIDDRQGINQVSTIRKKLKNARVEIEKEGKAMRDPLTKISKSISAKEQELVAIIEPTEKALKTQEDWVKAEEKRLEEEAAAKEKARIQARIDKLAGYGFTIDIAFIEAISDEDFEKVVENAKTQYDQAQAAAAEKARQEQAQRDQDEKDRAELKALREKQEAADKIIKDRQAELDRQEAELKRKQDEAVRLEKEKEAAAFKARTKARVGQLTGLGMIFDRIIGGGSYCYNGIYVSYGDQVEGLADDYWDILLEEVTKSIAQAKKEAEEKRIAEEERIRKEAAAKALEEQKEREAEAKRQEEERLAQASDKDKFAVLVSYLENLPAIEPKSAKHKKLLAEVKDLNAKAIAHIKAKV